MQVFLESKSGRMKQRNKQNRSSIVPISVFKLGGGKFFTSTFYSYRLRKDGSFKLESRGEAEDCLLRLKICFTSILLDTIRVLARHSCTYAIQVITDLNESNAKGELVAEPKKRKYGESSAELWAEGRALLEDEDEDVLATDEQKSIEQEQQYKYKPSSPSYCPTEPVYKRRPNNKSIILAMPAERAQPPAFWADDADDL